jgi:superfamily II RNA helicase
MERFSLIDAHHIVQLKGRAIAETDNPFNIVISELLFNGMFSRLEAVDIPALCSLFVNDAKGELEEETKGKLSSTLRTALEKTEEAYTDWVDAEHQSGVVEDGNELTMKKSLVFPVYQWAKGVPFLDITKLTPIREGNIVRTILRVHELIQRLRNVAVLMGNKELKAKLEVSLSLINRDIAFATSLYISG